MSRRYSLVLECSVVKSSVRDEYADDRRVKKDMSLSFYKCTQIKLGQFFRLSYMNMVSHFDDYKFVKTGSFYR